MSPLEAKLAEMRDKQAASYWAEHKANHMPSAITDAYTAGFDSGLLIGKLMERLAWWETKADWADENKNRFISDTIKSIRADIDALLSSEKE